jgi:hypothetical protein
VRDGVLATAHLTLQNHRVVQQQSSTLPESLSGLIERVLPSTLTNAIYTMEGKPVGKEFMATQATLQRWN